MIVVLKKKDLFLGHYDLFLLRSRLNFWAELAGTEHDEYQR